MNILKRKWALSYMKRLPAVSKFELCDKLRPYLRHHGLSLSDTGIVFPKERSYCRRLTQFAYACGIYEVTTDKTGEKTVPRFIHQQYA
mgnify:CR=1 FL=1